MPSPAAVSSPTLRLLLVEDSARLAEMLCDMLNDLNHVAVAATASDEAGALAALQQQRIDLAIIDLELRSGSGLGVLRQLKASPEVYGQPATVVFSNYGHQVLRTRCQALGVQHFFDKSFQLDELLDHVQAQADALTAPDRA